MHIGSQRPWDYENHLKPCIRASIATIVTAICLKKINLSACIWKGPFKPAKMSNHFAQKPLLAIVGGYYLTKGPVLQAKSRLDRPSRPHTPLKSHVFEHPIGIIQEGYGEYIIFRQLDNGQVQPLSEEEYHNVYWLLFKARMVEIASTNPSKNRRDHLLTELQQLDTHLKFIFIPRTVYDILAVKKLKARPSNCDKYKHPTAHICKQIELLKLHDRYVAFEEAKLVEHLAYKINRTICKQLAFKHPEGLTLAQILDLLDNEVTIHQRYCHSLESKHNLIWLLDRPSNIEVPAILHRAVKLECSALAQQAFILYRSALHSKDGIENPFGSPHSLSYGTSPLSGCIFDALTTPLILAQMHPNKNLFAIVIPFAEYKNAPFYIPDSHSIAQLLSFGGTYHARSKFWEGASLKQMTGNLNNYFRLEYLNRDPSKFYSQYRMKLSKEKLHQLFEEYHRNAINLKSKE